MEVILIKDIENLGYANDIVNVKPGYANNYLIPQGYAKAATAAAKKILAENLKPPSPLKSCLPGSVPSAAGIKHMTMPNGKRIGKKLQSCGH